jgi:hypothetical protein
MSDELIIHNSTCNNRTDCVCDSLTINHGVCYVYTYEYYGCMTMDGYKKTDTNKFSVCDLLRLLTNETAVKYMTDPSCQKDTTKKINHLFTTKDKEGHQTTYYIQCGESCHSNDTNAIPATDKMFSRKPFIVVEREIIPYLEEKKVCARVNVIPNNIFRACLENIKKIEEYIN